MLDSPVALFDSTGSQTVAYTTTDISGNAVGADVIATAILRIRLFDQQSVDHTEARTMVALLRTDVNQTAPTRVETTIPIGLADAVRQADVERTVLVSCASEAFQYSLASEGVSGAAIWQIILEGYVT